MPATGDTLRFPVRVKPGASRDRVGGSRPGTFGDAVVVAVQAPATDGKANAAVLRVLAAALGVRKRDLVVAQGERGRDKLVELTGAPEETAARLAELRAG